MEDNCRSSRRLQAPSSSGGALCRPPGNATARAVANSNPVLEGFGARVGAIGPPQVSLEFRPAHGPISLLRSLAHSRCDPQPIARALFAPNSPQIPCRTRCTFQRICSSEHRPSQDQDRAVLGAVNALAALDPAGYGLDGACAQLAGRIYVIAKGSASSFRR